MIAVSFPGACVTVVALAVSAQPNFENAWYRETMLGEVREALEEYRRLYMDAQRPRELRQRAAFRAARCAEKLGDDHVAGYYEWIRMEGVPGTFEYREAEAYRQRAQAGDAAAARRGARFAEALESTFRVRERSLASVRRQRLAQEDLASSVARVERRLESLGVEFYVEDLGPRLLAELQGPRSGRDPLEHAVVRRGWQPVGEFLAALELEPHDESALRARLAGEFYRRALKALCGLDLKAAWLALELHVETVTETSV
jgi:hypothetical protein